MHDEADVLVVGGGPAGLSAATWAARYRRRVVVVDAGEPRNRWVDASHGYLGADGVRPAELLARAREQLARYPDAALVGGRVTSIARRPGPIDDTPAFTADLSGGGRVVAHRVVLSTGVVDRMPDIAGFEEHYGADVAHCPTCDGFEARDQQVVVIGWSEHVAAFALGLLDWASSITVLTSGHRFEGDAAHLEALDAHGVRTRVEPAERFVGDRGSLRGVCLVTGEEVPCTKAFFSIEHVVVHELAEALGCATSPEGCVLTDDRCETSVEGVYAAGDLTPGVQLVQVAAAEGAVAGTHAAQSLRGARGARRSPTPAPDPESI